MAARQLIYDWVRAPVSSYVNLRAAAISAKSFSMTSRCVVDGIGLGHSPSAANLVRMALGGVRDTLGFQNASHRRKNSK